MGLLQFSFSLFFFFFLPVFSPLFVVSPDSRVAVSCGDDKTVRLWDVSTQESLHTFFDHDGSVIQARFHPDGTCVAACSADRTIKVRHNGEHEPYYSITVGNVCVEPGDVIGPMSGGWKDQFAVPCKTIILMPWCLFCTG